MYKYSVWPGAYSFKEEIRSLKFASIFIKEDVTQHRPFICELR